MQKHAIAIGRSEAKRGHFYLQQCQESQHHDTVLKLRIRVCCSVWEGLTLQWRSSAGLLQSGLRFWQILIQRHRGCCREVVALVGMNADPDGQRNENQQNTKAKLERSPIGEYAGHIEVEGQVNQRQQKHGGYKDHHGRHRIQSFSIRPILAARRRLFQSLK